MKGVKFLLVVATLGVIIIFVSAALIVPRLPLFPVDSVAASEWTHVCHSTVVFISLACMHETSCAALPSSLFKLFNLNASAHS